MSRRRGFTWYSAVGVAVTLVLLAVDGRRGFVASAAAWTLCLVVLMTTCRPPRVAVVPLSSKISGERRVAIGLVPLRLLIVLVGAAALYHRFGDDLGAGFWIATLVDYPAALLISVFWTLADLQRPE